METQNIIEVYTSDYNTGSIQISDKVPPLFHYAGPAGFKGMLDSKSLWFSNIHDQNDTEEFYHAIKLIDLVIKDEYPGLRIQNLNTLERYPIYTCSLTAARNLLSQWRGYCPGPEGGYCYSIQRAQLFKMIGLERLMLAKCVYSEQDKIALIKDRIIGITPQDYLASKKSPESGGLPGATLIPGHNMHIKRIELIRRNIVNYATVMKHDAFREEQEWRIVTYNNNQSPLGSAPYFGRNPSLIPQGMGLFTYHPLNGTGPFIRKFNDRTIEYRVMPLTQTANEEVILDEVIVGPMRDKEIAKAECELLMQKHGGSDRVVDSAIPYRSW